MSPDEVWGEIETLNGMSLRTIERRLPFKVVEVSDTEVVIERPSNARGRQLSRKVIMDSFMELLAKRELTSEDILLTVGPQHAAYVITLLATLPDVAICRKPIRLIYNGMQLFYIKRQ